MISRKKEVIIFLSILVLFIGLHVAGLGISYQQDEMKWTYYAKYELNPPGTIPHPPLTELLYTKAGPIVGDNNYRLIPFAFGLINLFLIFYLAKIIFGTRTALWTAFLFTVAYFSLLASLMVDVDGAFMPMFFLIMTIAYYKLRDKNFELKSNWLWLIVLIFGAVGGFLVKVSGILPLGALALDFAIERGIFRDRKRIIKYALLGLAALIISFAIIYLSKYIFTYFNISKSLKYWEHFGNSSSFLDRGWLQTFIQFAKSILYTSPLLIIPAFFIDREIWRKTRIFFFFVVIATLFYLFAFDFSIGALDRYFQLFVIPFCIISAAVYSKYFENKEDKAQNESGNKILQPVFLIVAIFILQFLPHSIPPHHPKTLWLNKMLSLEWNFLFPFTGGSGPLPFYVSFLFIAVIWVACLLFVITALKNSYIKKQALIGVFIFGLVYNAVFIEEYLFGRINGHTQTLVNDAISYIKSDDKIKKVLVYNDNGGFEVQQIGKYQRRIYAVPAYEESYKAIFDGYKGNILFINIPHLADNSFYKKFFDTCTVIYSKTSKQISSKIYDCSI